MQTTYQNAKISISFSTGSMPPDPPLYYEQKGNSTPPKCPKNKTCKSNGSLRKHDIHFHNKKMESLLPLTELKLQPRNYRSKLVRFFMNEVSLIYIYKNSKLKSCQSCLNDSGTKERGPLRVKICKKKFPVGASIDLHLWRSFRKSVSIYSRSAPVNLAYIYYHLLRGLT